MIKKAAAQLLIIVFVFSLFNYSVVADINFSDLTYGHWAYSPVMTLVKDGTVKGFEDGEFKPNSTVSRAEFVKMIGKGSQRRQSEFNDVNSSYWGYEYIMYSGLEGNGNNFNPDTAIKRNDVLDLIWKRNGSIKDITAPSIITSQGTNKDAVAWGYTYGIMAGDDGVNLRLSDTLTRAEAAALIVRSRGINESSAKKDFIDTVSPKVLEVLYNSVKLFGNIPYDENRTITNGEMARAAVRLGSEEFNLTYKNYNAKSEFEHKYSMDLSALGNSCIGIEKINKEYIDKPANVKDTLASLAYNIIKKSRSGVIYGSMGDFYKDIDKADNNMMDICLTYAKTNGVQLYADGSIKPDKSITLKEFACILLQLDSLIGSQSIITTDYINGIQLSEDCKINVDINSYPGNYQSYQCILEGLPAEVYNVPFADNDKKYLPKESYDFSREFGFIFTTMLDELKAISEKDTRVKLRFSYYPSLVCNNGNGVTMRIRCDVLDNPDNLTVKSIFKSHTDVQNDLELQKGSVFYADIITGQPYTDIYMPVDKAMLKKIVYHK